MLFQTLFPLTGYYRLLNVVSCGLQLGPVGRDEHVNQDTEQSGLPSPGREDPVQSSTACSHSADERHAAVDLGTGAKGDVTQDAREGPLVCLPQGLTPGLGKFHMPCSNLAYASQRLSPGTQSRCSTTREATAMRNPRAATESRSRSPQPESPKQQQRPSATKTKEIEIIKESHNQTKSLEQQQRPTATKNKETEIIKAK